jgi:hypothetical protein
MPSVDPPGRAAGAVVVVVAQGQEAGNLNRSEMQELLPFFWLSHLVLPSHVFPAGLRAGGEGEKVKGGRSLRLRIANPVTDESPAMSRPGSLAWVPTVWRQIRPPGLWDEFCVILVAHRRLPNG